MDSNEQPIDITKPSSHEVELPEDKTEVEQPSETNALIEVPLPEEKAVQEPASTNAEQPAEPPAASVPDRETAEGARKMVACDDAVDQEKEETTESDSEKMSVRNLIADRLEKADRSCDYREEDTCDVSDEMSSEELHPETKLKKRNRLLAEENERLLMQVADLSQRLAESSADVKQLVEEKKGLESQLAEVREMGESLQRALAAAQDKIEEQDQNLEKRLKELSTLQRSQKRTKETLRRAERELEEEWSEKDRLSQQLEAVSIDNADLRQKLELEGTQKARLEQDLAICESARQHLILQTEELQQQERRIREKSGWETASSLVSVLTKLSTLARLEPQETKGLSERAVFEELRELLARQAGGRLEAFPTKQEMAGETLWLDPDQSDLAGLLERYDWSPDRPFEGLPAGERRLPFRVSKRGWMVGGRVLAQARVVPESMSPDLAPQIMEGQGFGESEDS